MKLSKRFVTLLGVVFIMVFGVALAEDHHDHDHDHDHDEEHADELPPTTAFFTEELQELYGNTAKEYSMDSVQKLLYDMGLQESAIVTHGDHDDHEGHDHRRRREVHGYCLNADQLFDMHNITSGSNMTQAQFEQNILAPAVQMSASKSCAHSDHAAHSTSNKPSSGAVWGYSIVAVFIVSLLGLAGILFVPLLMDKSKKTQTTYLLAGLIALAVGTLVADALLHLIPEGLGLHNHGDEEGHEGHDHGSEVALSNREVIFRMCVCLAGAYFIYLVENGLHMFGPSHTHEPLKLVESPKHFPEGSNVASLVAHSPEDSNSTHMAALPAAKSEPAPIEAEQCVSVDNSCNSSEQDQQESKKHHKEILTKDSPWYKRITTVGWVILVGDGFHNFVDGIAIGASFSQSTTLGITTTIAIVLHEVTQEIGDFAVLITNGLTKWEALICNFISGCTAFIGVIVGILAGSNSVPWILLFTAGMFLYIALFDMLHQISELKVGNKYIMFGIIQLGLLVGWTVMLIIGLYAENIQL